LQLAHLTADSAAATAKQQQQLQQAEATSMTDALFWTTTQALHQIP
jgi:hypothetical protein